jgi:hypothetical protein
MIETLNYQCLSDGMCLTYSCIPILMSIADFNTSFILYAAFDACDIMHVA